MSKNKPIKPEDVDDFDELLEEALDDFANPNLMSDAVKQVKQQKQQSRSASTSNSADEPKASMETLRENASTADLLKPLAGLSLDQLDEESSGGDFQQLMSKLETDFSDLDQAVKTLLEPSPEDENDPEVKRIKEELRKFTAKVDQVTSEPQASGSASSSSAAAAQSSSSSASAATELGQTLAETLHNLNATVEAHARHSQATHLPKPQQQRQRQQQQQQQQQQTGGDTEEIAPFMENLMQTLLSKDVIYPSLRTIREKYPHYLEEHASELSSADRQLAEQRLTVIGQVCDEYERLGSSKPTSDEFEKLLTLVQQMQALGPPPEELLSDNELPNLMPQCPQM